MTDNEIIKAYATGITKGLVELLAEDSPFPEFCRAWLDSTRPIAEAYSAGLITREEMKHQYDERKGKLVEMFVLLMMRDCPDETEPLRRIIFKRCASCAND